MEREDKSRKKDRKEEKRGGGGAVGGDTDESHYQKLHQYALQHMHQVRKEWRREKDHLPLFPPLSLSLSLSLSFSFSRVDMMLPFLYVRKRFTSWRGQLVDITQREQTCSM